MQKYQNAPPSLVDMFKPCGRGLMALPCAQCQYASFRDPRNPENLPNFNSQTAAHR